MSHGIVLLSMKINSGIAGGEYNVEQNNSLLSNLENKMIITYMDDESLANMKQIAVDTVWPQFATEDNGTEDLVHEINALR